MGNLHFSIHKIPYSNAMQIKTEKTVQMFDVKTGNQSNPDKHYSSQAESIENHCFGKTSTWNSQQCRYHQFNAKLIQQFSISENNFQYWNENISFYLSLPPNPLKGKIWSNNHIYRSLRITLTTSFDFNVYCRAYIINETLEKSRV